MSEQDTPYEKFKTQVETILKVEPEGLTWTEIKQRLNLPQRVPNNRWVRKMEEDIGLLREKMKGKTYWRLK